MKKVSHLLVGVVIGALLATAGSAAAAQISLVGKKVTGEYSIKVNGKTLADKGSVIDGRANVPVRALSDALGANLAIEGRTIVVTTEEATATQTESPTVQPDAATDNKYAKSSVEGLQFMKANAEDRLKQLEEGKALLQSEIENLKKFFEEPNLASKEKELADHERMLAEVTEELRLINEALATK